MIHSSIPAVLRERASLQPNDLAVTYVDYERDWNGYHDNLTWAQLYRRSLNIARELRLHGAAGDRVVISAPQGLHYVTGFLGALQAGLIAVPLSVPEPGAHDERMDSVLRDTTPALILTTSDVVDNVAGYAEATASHAAPLVVEMDRMDLDARNGSAGTGGADRPEIAYLQYTSGSTRKPAGVVMSHGNLLANFTQVMTDYFEEFGGLAPADSTTVSWLPFYHDMGLILGVCEPVLGGYHSVFTTPVSFLQRPARWLHLMADHHRTFSAGPNFAFELTVKRTTDDDMAGRDLGGVMGIVSGSERIHPATLRRFSNRFAPFGLRPSALRPSYGLAEATVYVTSNERRDDAAEDSLPEVVHFDSVELSAGIAKRRGNGDGTPLVSYRVPTSPRVLIVDPETRLAQPDGSIGEIWVHGDNIALGYWEKPEQTEETFGGQLAGAEPDGERWLRTGDMGFVSEGRLFIMGRVKDMLIVYGRNHYPDDIEATIQEITGGRVAAIAVPGDRTEKLVAIIEIKKRDVPHDEVMAKITHVKRKVTSAISSTHGLGVADLVLVPPGSIPITTSGKVRRSACVEHYRLNRFDRLDTSSGGRTGQAQPEVAASLHG